LELIERGHHREAMFWIAVTYARCQKVLSADASREQPKSFGENYRELLNDLGIASFPDIQRRCAEVERLLPRVRERAERIIASNQRIEHD